MKVKNLLQLIVGAAVVALIVADCGIEAKEPELFPTETTVPVTQPVETTVPPETEPPAPSGIGVTADGDKMQSGSILLDNRTYVKAGEFLSALDRGVCAGNDSIGFVLDWEGEIIRFRPEHYGVQIYRGELWLPLEETCELLNISILEDPEEDRVYCTSGILHQNIPEGIHVPVLMYHAVDSDVWGLADLFLNPEVMESHLKFLLDNGYDPIFFEDLPYLDQYDKPVIITFDDGYLDNYTHLYPLLQKYQVKATIFVVCHSIDHLETSMTSEQVKELSDSGLVSIQSHTVNHRVLRDLPAEEQEMEMERSRLYLARMTGREPFAIAYPTGVYNEDTLQLSMQYYRYAVTVEDGDFVTGGDTSAIRRYYVRRRFNLDDLAWMVCDAGKIS